MFACLFYGCHRFPPPILLGMCVVIYDNCSLFLLIEFWYLTITLSLIRCRHLLGVGLAV